MKWICFFRALRTKVDNVITPPTWNVRCLGKYKRCRGEILLSQDFQPQIDNILEDEIQK
jgi:hypothetical protein